VQLGGSREEGVCVYFVGKRAGEGGPLERGGLFTAAAAAAAGLVQRSELLLVLHPLLAAHLETSTETREGRLRLRKTIKVAQCLANSAVHSREYDCFYCTAQPSTKCLHVGKLPAYIPSSLHPKCWSLKSILALIPAVLLRFRLLHIQLAHPSLTSITSPSLSEPTSPGLHSASLTTRGGVPSAIVSTACIQAGGKA
jgi:hypothetical protein